MVWTTMKYYKPYGHCKQQQEHWCEAEQQMQLVHSCIWAEYNDAGTQNMQITKERNFFPVRIIASCLHQTVTRCDETSLTAYRTSKI
jgi:hypothetical protein